MIDISARAPSNSDARRHPSTLNNLDKIPPRGALAYVGLIPREEGSGGRCRVIANWEPRR